MSCFFLRILTLTAGLFLLSPFFGRDLQAQEEETPKETASEKADDKVGSLKKKMLDLEKMKGERNKILARIKQIDAIIIPIQEKLVVEVVGLDVDEYRALKMQAENSSVGSQYFPKLRKGYTADLGGASAYFDEAYEALSKGKLWVGREEKLIQDDVALLASVDVDVTEAMMKLPNGRELVALMQERADLRSKLEASSPLFNYLVERRRWWSAYPDYIDTLKADHPAATAPPAP